MSESQNLGELVVTLLATVDAIPADNYKAKETIAAYLYLPDEEIPNYLKSLKDYLKIDKPTPREQKEAGYLLEQIATLAFGGLRGIGSIKSFQSAGPQYDLLLGGDSADWLTLCKLLFMKGNQRDIVVEAKCTTNKVNDQQFARLCSIMESNLSNTTGIGVFFTLNGATGFPDKGNKIRQKSLTAARLRQALFYARTQKAIVVLDSRDIFELDKPASLIMILISKIRDLDHHSGIYVEPCIDLVEEDLPGHLKPLMDRLFPKAYSDEQYHH